MLLGVVAMAAGVMLTIGSAAEPHPVGQAIALSGGVALFLAGDAWFRAALRIGTPWPRLATAAFALAATALGATVAVEAQLAVLLGALVAMLAAERYAGASPSRLRRVRKGGWEA
jgi:low temperature requirement protein LtrA